MSKKYANNEDIILTSKRIFPDKQNMPDPNKEPNRYRKVQTKKKRVKNFKTRETLPSIWEDGKRKPRLLREIEKRKFLEEMTNSCHRCGKDITRDKVFSPLTYSYGLCPPCNTDLENSVRG